MSEGIELEFPEESSQPDLLEQARKIVDQRFERSQGVNSLDIARTAEQMEALSLAEIESGDVVWWKNQSGTSSYYFLVGERSASSPSRIEGSLKAFGENGDIKREYEKIIFSGASLGNMIKSNEIMKGYGVTLVIPLNQEEVGVKPPDQLRTSPVADMGIIKGKQLSPKVN